MNTLHVISLGAGVQSSTMALMAAHGEIEPMPDCAIFADTGVEPKPVYAWLNWLETKLPFPIYRVKKGNLAKDAIIVKTSKNGKKYSQSAIPAFIHHDDGRVGVFMRQCTRSHKIIPIIKKISEIRQGKNVIQWIGISCDEAHRIKPSRTDWIENRWPLIEKRMHRQQCIEWMKSHGYEKPPRSACVFCPYRGNDEWRDLIKNDPEGFNDAVEFERNFQTAMSQINNSRGGFYLHRSGKSLSDIDFNEDDKQLDMFGNECEGMCWL